MVEMRAGGTILARQGAGTRMDLEANEMADRMVSKTFKGTAKLHTGDLLTVLPGGRILGKEGPAIAAADITVRDTVVHIAGEVAGREGIFLNGPLRDGIPGGHHTVIVEQTGSVFGHRNGVFTTGDDNHIINAGLIESGEGGAGSQKAAIWNKGGGLSVENSGIISGDYFGIRGLKADRGAADVSGPAEIVNSGTIEGGGQAVVVHVFGLKLINTDSGIISGESGVRADGPEESDAALDLINFGTIAGTKYAAVIASVNDDVVKNFGTITGDVFTSHGNDRVVNGGLIDGTVDLFNGDDVYRSLGSGLVTGTLRGGGGNDLLIGGAGTDQLEGQYGRDILRGRGGDDTFWGGNGDDVMTGGRGADVFRFNPLDSTLGNDRITDFTPGTDKLLMIRPTVDFAQVMVATSDTAEGALIDTDLAGNGGSVLLEGVTVAELSESDFIF